MVPREPPLSARVAMRLAILTNILAPQRVDVYRALARHFDVCVFLSGREDNRDWYANAPAEPFEVVDVPGITIKNRKVGPNGSVADVTYFHANPGYFPALARFRPDAVI